MEENKELEENGGVNFESRINLEPLKVAVDAVRNEIGKVIVGQDKMIDQLLVAILANGHVLIEGAPGVAKTVTAKLLARTLSLNFSRIQFTPDLMPSDIIGTSVFDVSKSAFEFKRGPVFANFVLIDEINRAPAKTQAALFEVMEERQITADGTTYLMDPPFLVIATQNPIEQEGTYRLPEAQLDRFLFKINVGYPSLEEEVNILVKENKLENKDKMEGINTVIAQKELVGYQELVKKIKIEEHLFEYIARLVMQTREHQFLYLGGSPRASIALLNAAKGFAAIRGRDFVTPDDIKDAAVPVLQHRIIVSPEREMEGLTASQVIGQIVDSVEIPR
ncbi:MoxR family ATPase [Wandonia haliotis]|uniref:MoxR family ATPase n=1 Tax=Wandonia haliotis TaxID=574963 RepID=A0ABN1ML62_9FLAO